MAMILKGRLRSHAFTSSPLTFFAHVSIEYLAHALGMKKTKPNHISIFLITVPID